MASNFQFGGAAASGQAESDAPDRRTDESEVGANSRPNPLSPGDANAQAGNPNLNKDAPSQPSLGDSRGQPSASSAAANAKMAEGLIAFEVAAGQNPDGEAPPSFLYSSKPIERFELGRFSFVDGYMGLYSEDDAAEFEKLVKAQPIYTVVHIKRLAGNTPVARKSAFNQGVDHTGNTTHGAGAQD